MQKLTNLDTQIIEALRKDARQPNKPMATKIGVSEETVRRRVHAMVKSGALQFDVSVSAEALGMPVQALINVQVSPDTILNLMQNSPFAHVKRVHDTVEGHQVYEIAAESLQTAGAAVREVRFQKEVINATITFLYPNGDNRI